MMRVTTQSILYDLTLNATERVVLSKFNDFANQLGLFFAHLETLSKHLGLSKRQIQRIISSLIKKKKIEKQRPEKSVKAGQKSLEQKQKTGARENI